MLKLLNHRYVKACIPTVYLFTELHMYRRKQDQHALYGLCKVSQRIGKVNSREMVLKKYYLYRTGVLVCK